MGEVRVDGWDNKSCDCPVPFLVPSNHEHNVQPLLSFTTQTQDGFHVYAAVFGTTSHKAVNLLSAFPYSRLPECICVTYTLR